MHQAGNRVVRIVQAGLIVCCMGWQLDAFCQFSDSVNHYIGYAATGTINKTNDGNSYVFTNALKFNINKKDIAFNSTTNYIYGQQRRRLTNNDFSSALDFNLYKTFPHFYYWGLAGYDRSYSLKINNRLQSGLGAAYKLIDKRTGSLNLSDGILFEYGDINANDTTRRVYRIFRNSLRIRFRWVIRELVILDGNNFLQSSLSDGNDYNIRSVTSLSFKLVKWLNFTTAANYNRLHATGRETLLITFGLTTDKYF